MSTNSESHAVVPRWVAYKELFAAVKNLRRPKLSQRQLLDEINADAPKSGFFSCSYSARSLLDYTNTPKGARTGEPPPNKAKHLYLWLSKQIESIGSTEELQRFLEAIAPTADNDQKLEIKPDEEVPMSKQGDEINNMPSKSATDWERPEVLPFLSKINLLDIIDGAISLYNGPEYIMGKGYWPIDDVTFKVEGDRFTIKELKLFEKDIMDWAEKNKDQRRGMKYCVIEIQRPTLEGNKKLTLVVRPIEYHLVKPINKVLEAAYGDHAPPLDRAYALQFRKNYFSQLKDRNHPLIPNFLTLQVTVVSRDNKLLLFKRRKKGLDSFHDSWSASFEEGLNADIDKYLGPQIDRPPFTTPDVDIKAGFKRALKEELRISDDINAKTGICITAVVLEFDNLNTALIAIARVPLDMKDILSNRELRSSEEFDSFAHCPFDIQSLLPVLLKNGALPKGLVSPGGNPIEIWQEWKWHPTSRMRIYRSLVDQFGAEAINKYFL